MSLAWEHRKRVIAAQSALVETALHGELVSADGRSKHKLLLDAMKRECENLSALPKGTARTAVKRELLETYLPDIDDYLNSGKVYANTALTQVMIWCFDTGDMENAMRLAQTAIKQEQPMPERFKRDIRTGVADLLMDWINTRNGLPIEPYFSNVYNQLFPADGPGWAIHDDIKIKYIKIAIREAEKSGNPARSLELCDLAEKIDPVNAKVKTRKEKLMKELKAEG